VFHKLFLRILKENLDIIRIVHFVLSLSFVLVKACKNFKKSSWINQNFSGILQVQLFLRAVHEIFNETRILTLTARTAPELKMFKNIKLFQSWFKGTHAVRVFTKTHWFEDQGQWIWGPCRASENWKSRSLTGFSFYQTLNFMIYFRGL
jgi:hypothetical protein